MMRIIRLAIAEVCVALMTFLFFFLLRLFLDEVSKLPQKIAVRVLDSGYYNRDLCRDSTEAGSNLLKLSVTDGFFWRSEIPLATLIGPLSDPRPLPCRPLPKKDFASTSALA
jgi:hypothetical protein